MFGKLIFEHGVEPTMLVLHSLYIHISYIITNMVSYIKLCMYNRLEDAASQFNVSIVSAIMNSCTSSSSDQTTKTRSNASRFT